MKKRTHPFILTYRESFKAIYKKMCEDFPTYIVAIARKGPRLFDLFKDDIGGSLHNPIVVSDRAIPYLNVRKSEHVPLFDDIVIFGSTMRDKMHELEMIGVNPIPYSLVYDIERAKLENVVYSKSLNKEVVASFCDDIVSAIQLLPKPYDTDHPILTTTLPMDCFERLKIEIFNKLGKRYFIDLTSSLQRKNDILNFVILYSPPFELQSIFSEFNSVRPSHHKIRLYYDKQKEKLAIAPMFIVDILFKNFDEPLFNEQLDIFNIILKEARKNMLFDRKNEVEKSIYRLILWLTDYLYGLFFLSSFGLLSYEFELSREDVYYLYGDKFGKYLINVLQLREMQTTLNELNEETSISQLNREKQIENIKLFNEIFWNTEYQELNNRMKWTNEVDSLWNILRLLEVKDLITRKPEYLYIPGRLEFGFTFQDLLLILKEKTGTDINRDTLSVVIDYFKDRGALVPLVMKYPTGYWVTPYRFGENLNGPEEKKRAYFTRISLERLFNNIEDQDISQYDFEKFFAYLIQVFTKRDQPAFEPKELSMKDLNLAIILDEFGARPITEGFRAKFNDVIAGVEKRFLIQEAKDNFVVDMHETPSGTRISLSKDFEIVYPSNMNPLQNAQPTINLYVDLWTEIIYNLKPWERKDEMMLLMTTCNNKDNFLKAFEVGVESWFTHDFSRYPKILNKVKLLISSTPNQEEYEQEVKEVDKLLHENAKRLRQSEKKKSIWMNRDEMIQRIEKAVKGKSMVEPLWEHTKNLLFDSSPFTDEEELLFNYIDEILKICTVSTTVLRSALKEREKGELSKYINSYNDVIKQLRESLSLTDLREITDSSLNKLVDVLEHNYPILYEFFSRYIRKREKRLIDEVGLNILKRAIELSKKSSSEDGKIRPKVGAVIVKEGRIIGEGYRNQDNAGGHAEEIAIKSCKENPSGAILVTTMEPCTIGDHKIEKKDFRLSCASLIVEYKMKGVIYGILDPNEKIRGKGIQFLTQWGILTESFPASLQREILEINKEYISQFPMVKPEFDYS